MRWIPPLALLVATSACASPPPAPATMPAPKIALPVLDAAPKETSAPKESLLLPPGDRPSIPEWNGATAWLNVDRPLRRDALRGHVVVVDFWTSCCINCLQTLPTLAAIERRFAKDPVLVVGVHSPKFDEEKNAARLRDTLRDLEIVHPVAVDANMTIWDAWGVRAWPTVALIDAEGRLAWVGSGEPDPADLSGAVEEALAEGRATNVLAKAPIEGLRPDRGPAGVLRYPGKVLALQNGGLAIADTGHHRIVLTNAAGAVEAVFGSGEAGAKDGAAERATFQRPQGMTEVGADLYVADTGNHLIRKIDRATRQVITVAGTGELGAEPLGLQEHTGRTAPLRSPWDLLHHKGSIYVALAGSHQIAVFDPKMGTVRLYAGSGREAREDGPAQAAAFAQPSALATDDKSLFVLDSETSSVRAIDFATATVRTVIGVDLFVFGDVDGEAAKARLQHPIGMTYGQGALWVADSYNGKVKRVDPAKGTTRTVLTGLAEPAGITVAGKDLVVADTNKSRIVRRAITASGEAAPVAFAGLAPPKAP
ncbi:thioredoxin-like domain-containing protein [Polyangium sorediatum]|uniref:Thioredoxin-like domain-containing protein n=1 Tax=Polyangium sorediatum TaxID=889274 RepID=A0ABT6NTW1_9BACT|nr:thioredoxin-like domain-containing protein [Polyangium sorediatum]MDI1431570.1 thioredoxin-like domain-containing protein [Polyangium sorediatum]